MVGQAYGGPTPITPGRRPRSPRRVVVELAVTAVAVLGTVDRWVVHPLDVAGLDLGDHVAVGRDLLGRVGGGDEVVPVEAGDLPQLLEDRAPGGILAGDLQCLGEQLGR